MELYQLYSFVSGFFPWYNIFKIQLYSYYIRSLLHYVAKTQFVYSFHLLMFLLQNYSE